ncbi:cilia- and flagella-associated protein 61 [Xylocopa sonorina]|uniref:cilia- and flagella-associated protein 61 n=1 Tax=Xylocopa sonorina TaxID=1818115 RepID=UPI00403B1CFA
MMNIWLGDVEAYFLGKRSLDPVSEVLGVRRMEHSDLPDLERLIRPETYEIFGDVDLGRVYEASCLSMVQCNEKREVVSGLCLCNYPNVPSVIPEEWPHWLRTLYRVENVTESNAMFAHILLWDKRYTGRFFEDLLTGFFDVASYLLHVILVVPPGIILADVFEQQMIRVPPRCTTDRYSVQSLYMTERHLKHPRLRIRRAVEEDNDDVIPIIDAESTLLKEYYGEFYLSEMIRHPDGCRQLIVSEDDDGVATGVMCLNSTVDVKTLNENFELGPYNGLRKPHKDDRFPPESMMPDSETFFNIFSRKLRVETTEGFSLKVSSEESMEREEAPEITTNTMSTDYASSKVEAVNEEQPQLTFLSSIITNLSDVYHQSKLMTSAFIESFDVPRELGTIIIGQVENTETLPLGIELPSQPVYYGERNAFVLEIFATQEHIKQRWGRNFVEAAFECYQNLDYCAILLPFSHPSLPLLEHFVRVPLRCNKDYPMTLYVTHRAALLVQVQLREAVLSDREGVQELLQRIPKAELILADFDATVRKERSDLYCYVCQWNNVIVGVAILCAEKEVTYIRRRYHVEDHIAARNIPEDAYGRILHFVLMPIFSVHLHHFFCEIMRLTGMIVLYYRLRENAFSALTRTHPLTICLNRMVPVNPRYRIEYKYSGFVETDEPEEETEPFSLFMTTPRLAMIPSSIIESKIVVVGASDCGVAFLEHLALGQSFKRFTNLTLISPNGLPFDSDTNDASTRLVPFKGRYCRKYRRLVAARTWINIVYGTVVAIQRKKKYVSVMHQGNVEYDYLILTCGLQYQRPRFQKELEAQKKGEYLEHETPWNCITINDDTEAATCLEKIQVLTQNLERERKIIFYGHNVDCYCALQGLLEFGAKGSWITLIQPPLEPCATHDTAFYNDCELYVEVMNSIRRNDIEILVGWQLIEWYLMDSPKGKMIESIVIRLKGETRTMDCDALVIFLEKTINMNVFLAICKAGLVFDGRLVIDPDMRTNDPSIFAAGTMTKYCRKLYADSWQHVYFYSVEVGERLAKVLRSIIDSHHRGVQTPFEPYKGKTFLAIPVFRLPNIVACTLPGGYRYVHTCKPGKAMLMATRHDVYVSVHDYGEVLVTGTCTSELGYFRIRLNRFDTVEAVTCFNKKDFEVRHMIALYGKHETLLNGLKRRFHESLISDFYAYFREPWAMALFYDKFECLRVETRATLLSKTAIPGQSLVEDCIRALIKTNWLAMREEDLRCIQSRFAGSVYQQEIEENLLDFLQFFEEDLPVYCTPGKLRELYADIEDSPLYSDL